MLNIIRGLVTDRFVIFVLIGLGFFLVEYMGPGEEGRIYISANDIAMLEGRYELQTGRQPSEAELEALIAFHTREEILVREARRLGLDGGDVILRRRLAQKMELLLRDGLGEPVISEAGLDQYFRAEAERYRQPARLGFRHIYLGSGSEPNAEDVEAIRRALVMPSSTDSWREMGQAFMLAREYAPRPRAAIAELFGPDFADHLFESPEQQGWWGPVRSSYGWHLVQRLVFEPERQLERDEIQGILIEDFRTAELEAAEAEAFQRLADRYRVTVDQSRR